MSSATFVAAGAVGAAGFLLSRHLAAALTPHASLRALGNARDALCFLPANFTGCMANFQGYSHDHI
jgi:hypothetical protein